MFQQTKTSFKTKSCLNNMIDEVEKKICNDILIRRL